MTVKAYYLKTLIGTPVLSESGRQSGYIADFVVKLKSGIPCLEKAIVFAFDSSSHRIARRSEFKEYSPGKFLLEKTISDLPPFSETDGIVTATQLWDKSVIDTVNVRTVQINDLKLILTDDGTLQIAGIDISFAAAIRRLGLDNLVTPILKRFGTDVDEEIIDWDKLIGLGDEFSNITSEETSDNLQNLHPADLAEIIEELDEEERISVLENLDEDVAAETLAEVEAETQLQIIETMDAEMASDIIEEMDPDEAADLLQDMDQSKAQAILDHMDLDDSSDVRKLLEHREDTAGGLMTTEYAAIFEDFTVAQAFSHLRLVSVDIEIIYYLYVIDTHEHLKGVVSIRDLLSANPAQLVGEIMDDDIVSVHPQTEQAEVANLISKYDYMAIPVVDDQNIIVGVVTVDDVVDVIEEEASEDLFKFAGSSEEELNYTSPLQACRARLPWLLITLGTGFITSTILKNFMTEFSHVLVLAFFVPVVMAMGGNTGIQSSTLIIRGMALNSFSGSDLFRRLLSEIAAGALMGLACGGVVGIWARYLIASDSTAQVSHSAIFLALTVGIAMMAAMTFAAMFGALVPIVFDRFKIDPAVASGPFVTSSNDIFALIIYYSVAFLMLSQIQ
ncbi:MAG: magnesium transporter [Candidatus Rifleibacteriota bacterium]